ncbi:DUF448 domain-containing protein [Ferrovibrio sp.]|uniref:YlxR family protein n=1 Tax=Ferrovibrio sp. TaxID=1917215 RepID=UPI001B7C6FFE|nr:DUF448 domain-containing protein [Ferrovibrio sp.]MBP7062572.1 DUF448 domain-containing protein [Ferrovibrio sp.]
MPMKPAPKGRKDRARRCLGSGERRAPTHLIRFVIDATGEVMPDPGRKLGGRGLWLAPDAGLLTRLVAGSAAERKLFARAARRAVRVPADLPARTLAVFQAHCALLAQRVERAGPGLAADTPLRRRLARDLECLARLRGEPQLSGAGSEL